MYISVPVGKVSDCRCVNVMKNSSNLPSAILETLYWYCSGNCISAFKNLYTLSKGS